MKRRVLVISKYWYPRGGAEIVALEHARILERRGHSLAHFAMEHPQNIDSRGARFPRRVERGQVSPRALARPFYSIEVARTLRSIAQDHRPDVAIVHNVYHQLGAAVHLELQRLGVPVVHVLHDYKLVCPAYTMIRDGRPCTECRSGRFRAAAVYGCGGSRAAGLVLAAESYWQWRLAKSYANVEVFAAPSRFLIDRYRDFEFPYSIESLPNPAPPVSRARRSRAGVETIGFAGRLSAEKGADLVIACAQAFPEVRFRVAGTGELEDRLRRQSPDNVQWLGWLGREQLVAERASWDLALMPSRFAEVAPLVVLESLAAGVPVIVSEFGGAGELAGAAGIAVPPERAALERAIAALVGDRAQLDKMAAVARERAATLFSGERVGERLEELAELAITRHRGARAPRESSARES